GGWGGTSTTGRTGRPGRSGTRPDSGGWQAASRRPSPPPRASSGRCATSAAVSRPCGGCGSWPGGRSNAAGHPAAPSRRNVPDVPGADGGGAASPPVVIAGVVTYNRREVLLQALPAGDSQSRPPGAGGPVDNAATHRT